MVLCIAEDRVSCEPALRVLLASLEAFSPGLPVWLYLGHASPGFTAWLQRYPNVTVRPFPREDKGWNIKPTVLMEALDAGHAEAVWIDSDIVFTGDFRRALDGAPPGALVSTEESAWGTPHDGDAERARAWGFDVGRALPCTVNTCVLKVTQRHRGLLEHWKALQRSPHYLAAQELPQMSRPIHLNGGQDVLTAMLCTKEFSHVDVFLIRRGVGILQAFGLKGFTTRERIAALARGMPPIIHTQVFKPWVVKNRNDVGGGFYGALNLIYLDASPYTIHAAKYAASLDADLAWLKPRTKVGAILRLLGLGSAPLTGLPLAIVFDLVFGVARLVRPGPKSRRPATLGPIGAEAKAGPEPANPHAVARGGISTVGP